MTTLTIIFWKFAIFTYRFDLLQLKQNVKSSIKNFVYKLSNKFSNDLGPSFLRK